MHGTTVTVNVTNAIRYILKYVGSWKKEKTIAATINWQNYQKNGNHFIIEVTSLFFFFFLLIITWLIFFFFRMHYWIVIKRKEIWRKEKAKIDVLLWLTREKVVWIIIGKQLVPLGSQAVTTQISKYRGIQNMMANADKKITNHLVRLKQSETIRF